MKTQSQFNSFLLLFLHWSSRIICILFLIFISIFSLDAIVKGAGFWENALSLIIHSIPVLAGAILLVLSWKWSWIGGAGFLALGVLYIIWASHSGRGTSIIYIALFLIGAVFFADWFLRKAIRKAQEAFRD